MAKDIREFYRDQLYRATERVDTRIVLQMHRIISMTLDEIFVSLTARRTERTRRWGEGRWGEGTWGEKRGVVPEKDELAYFERAETIEQSNVAIDEVLTRSQYNVILGDPGTGKTTLLKWLAHRWAAGARRPGRLFEEGKSRAPKELAECVPVPLELRYFAQELDEGKTSTLEDYLGRGPWDWVEEWADEAGQFVLEQAQAGRCLLLLDGLDEAISKELRVRVVDAIDDFLRGRPGCRCVVSSRIVGYELAPLPQEFDVSTLAPFTPKQTSRFFHNWALAIERAEDIQDDDFTRRRASKRAEEILDGLGYDPTQLDDERREAADSTKRRLQELAQNPMLCTLIGLIHHQGKRMPEDRVELYRLCVEAFVYDWEVQKRVRQVDKEALDKFETMDVLEELALRLHESTSANRASLEEIRQIVFRFLTEDKGQDERAARVRTQHQINLTQGRVGLLIERGEGEYGFAHLQLQEYLTGRAITRRRRDVPVYLTRHLWESRWQEPILLAAAYLGEHREEDATEFVEAVRATPPPAKWRDVPDLEQLLHHALFMAVRCVGEAKRTQFRVRRAILGHVRAILDDRTRPHLWELTAKAMEPIGDKRCVDSLLHALAEDPDEWARSRAAEALGLLRSPPVTEALVGALRTDRSMDVRMNAATALGVARDENAIEPLIRSFLTDDCEDVRYNAALALAGIDGRKVLPILRKIAHGCDGHTMCRVADLLAYVSTGEAVSLLTEMLTQGESEEVQGHAAYALGRTGSGDAISHLTAALRGASGHHLRWLAGIALANMGEREGVLEVVDAAQNAEREDIRTIAIDSLASLGDREAIYQVLGAADPGDSEVVRDPLIHSLGVLGTDEDVARLIELLRSGKDEDLRIRAAESLGHAHSQCAVPALLEALQRDTSEHVRSFAVQALTDLRNGAVTRRLLQTLQEDESATVRGSAARALGARHAIEAAAPIADMLRDAVLEEIWWILDGALREIVLE